MDGPKITPEMRALLSQAATQQANNRDDSDTRAQFVKAARDAGWDAVADAVENGTSPGVD